MTSMVAQLTEEREREREEGHVCRACWVEEVLQEGYQMRRRLEVKRRGAPMCLTRRCSTENGEGRRGLWAKWPACPCSWGSWVSRRHEESTRYGRGGSGWTAHAQGDTHALEEKEERDGSCALLSHDV